LEHPVCDVPTPPLDPLGLIRTGFTLLTGFKHVIDLPSDIDKTSRGEGNFRSLGEVSPQRCRDKTLLNKRRLGRYVRA